jgi:DnaA family protein
MKQLALDLKLADYARFETFFAGPNTPVVDAIRDAATARGRQVHWLWGGQGAGKSHLLQAAVAAAGDRGQICAWLPLLGEGLAPGMLDGMGNLDLLCVDDVDSVAADSAWEHALFKVFEELRARDGRLIVTASVPMAQAGFRLRDLASRLASGPTWKLQPLTDEQKLAALQLRSRWRGLELSDDVGDYLLRRTERSNSALFSLLDQLDQAALVAKKGLTLPLVRSVIDNAGRD